MIRAGRNFAISLKRKCSSASGGLTMTIFLGGGGGCFVGHSKERGQLGQAVKGLSVAGRAVNEDAEDHGRARRRRE